MFVKRRKEEGREEGERQHSNSLMPGCMNRFILGNVLFSDILKKRTVRLIPHRDYPPPPHTLI